MTGPDGQELSEQIAFGIAGLEAALCRLDDVRNSHNPIEVGIPTVECAWWAAGLAEAIERPVATANVAISFETRALLDAVCWVRRCGLHQLVATDGEGLGSSSPFVHWAAGAESMSVQAKQMTGRTFRRRSAYNSEFANRSVDDTIGAVYDDLRALSSLLLGLRDST